MSIRTAVIALAALAACDTIATEPIRAQTGPAGTLVITNKSAATATIIDASSGNTLATLPTGESPHEIALTADGRLAVVTDYGTGQAPTLTVIDVPGRRVARTIDLGQYRAPHGIAFLPGDSLVAVTSEASQHVVIVHPASGAIRKAIPTRHAGSHMVAFGRSGDRLYTGNIGGNTVSELNPATGEYVRSWDVPRQPEAIGVSPDGTEVWVGSNAEGKVSVVTPATGAVATAAEGFGWPYRIVFTPDGQTVLMPDLRNEELRFVERATRRELGRLPFAGAAPQGIALTPDGRWAFLSLSGQGQVVLIDIANRTVVRSIQAGPTPDGVVFAPK